MNATDYQCNAMTLERTRAFLEEGLVDDAFASERLIHAALGVTSEAGELANEIKKLVVFGRTMDRAAVLGECGDILWFVTLALDAIGLTLEQAMDANIAKLTTRTLRGKNPEAERMLLETYLTHELTQSEMAAAAVQQLGAFEQDL
jgi:NTP pyrophosphatase (non-canonical NTP hydrolase)